MLLQPLLPRLISEALLSLTTAAAAVPATTAASALAAAAPFATNIGSSLLGMAAAVAVAVVVAVAQKRSSPLSSLPQ